MILVIGKDSEKFFLQTTAWCLRVSEIESGIEVVPGFLGHVRESTKDKTLTIFIIHLGLTIFRVRDFQPLLIVQIIFWPNWYIFFKFNLIMTWKKWSYLAVQLTTYLLALKVYLNADNNAAKTLNQTQWSTQSPDVIWNHTSARQEDDEVNQNNFEWHMGQIPIRPSTLLDPIGWRMEMLMI